MNTRLARFLGSIANMLPETLKTSLPAVRRGDSETLFEVRTRVDDDGMVLFLYIDFAVRDRDIRGYIALILDLSPMGVLKWLLGEFVERVTTDG